MGQDTYKSLKRLEASTGIFYHSNTLIYLSFLVFYQQYYQLKEIVRLALGY